ncbi:MAG: cardiolipin synthase [Bacteroidales bacterium]|nr:cardiolipin synthase [Bacteroidales bacterium]MCM1415559.1 cardiolipin synthase [bacterium]MCM1424087.1 cardiolipin synthase [bacterium]
MSGEIKESEGISLLKKGQKGIVHAVFSRMGIMLVLLAAQIMFIFSVFRWFGDFLPHILGGTVLFTVIMVLYLLNSRMDPTAKITWLVVVMLLPVFGALFYCYIQSDIGHKAMKKRIDQIVDETKDLAPQSAETWERLASQDPGAASLARYIARRSGPVYENTLVTYFPLGENKFEEMLRQLEQAKEFIFLEYFIIDEGFMWGKVLEILARKARDGVDVRVMYDGMCEFALLSHDYPKRMKQLGIRCKAFAPVSPFFSTHYNYRDHRKILVIDGHTAFNGGVNLADEYINHTVKYGHWKDTAVMLQGEAVKSFTLMFLQMWNMSEMKPEFDRFLNAPARQGEGFVIPYGDRPLDDDKVGERVYMDILNRAQRYVYIMSPYLILDGEMETALKFAAERGVDVRLILPGVPDKTAPYALAKTHYASLLASGIQIYEYTPGFVHAKVFLADDREAVVGTINLDYRSLYHHFECATYMNGVSCIPEIRTDFEKTFSACRQVTKGTIWQGKAGLKMLGVFLKAVAPLM